VRAFGRPCIQAALSSASDLKNSDHLIGPDRPLEYGAGDLLSTSYSEIRFPRRWICRRSCARGFQRLFHGPICFKARFEGPPIISTPGLAAHLSAYCCIFRDPRPWTSLCSHPWVVIASLGCDRILWPSANSSAFLCIRHANPPSVQPFTSPGKTL
jgi:hypothetical protein